MKPLPAGPTPNERALAQEYRERLTGIVGVALSLTYTPLRTTDDVGLELIAKNGVVLDPNGGAGGYSISGKDITLGAAAIAGDVFLILYSYRT